VQAAAAATAALPARLRIGGGTRRLAGAWLQQGSGVEAVRAPNYKWDVEVHCTTVKTHEVHVWGAIIAWYGTNQSAADWRPYQHARHYVNTPM
jgi:hypothetical protein